MAAFRFATVNDLVSRPVEVEDGTICRVASPLPGVLGAAGRQTRDGTSQFVFSSVKVTGGKFIALTFDDGPQAKQTPKLLDLLKREKVPATFFLVGQNVDAHPDIVKRAHGEGHEMANHSYAHPKLSSMKEAQVNESIRLTQEAIEKACGHTPTLFRPPYGAFTSKQEATHKKFGLKIILWSVDPNDWQKPGAATVTQRIVANTRGGSIILAHDIHAGTVDAMPKTLEQLKAKEFKFLTVSQLLAQAKS